MRDFPWLEAALFIAMAVALIVRPSKPQPEQQFAGQQASVQTASVSYPSLLGH